MRHNFERRPPRVETGKTATQLYRQNFQNQLLRVLKATRDEVFSGETPWPNPAGPKCAIALAAANSAYTELGVPHCGVAALRSFATLGPHCAGYCYPSVNPSCFVKGTNMMTNAERFARKYALHLAMMVRRRGRELWLFECYGDRQKFGPFRSWRAVQRAISECGAAEIKRMKREKSRWMRVAYEPGRVGRPSCRRASPSS
jgi:hypothetical protein